MNTTKLLVSGEPNQYTTTLLQRITTLNQSKSGPFDAVLCIGTLWDNITSIVELNQLQIDIPIYCISKNSNNTPAFILDIIKQHDKPSTVELRHNLYYLYGCGITQFNNLSVAYVSGVHTDSYETQFMEYNNADIDKLIDICTTAPYQPDSIDVLLTSQWPSSQHDALFHSIHSYTAISITKLSTALNVRYHFTAHDKVYYASPPYRNSVNYTRFMSIASIENQFKSKWLYAVNVQKLHSIDKSILPNDIIDCPYTSQSTADSNNGTNENNMIDYNSKLDELHQQANKRQKLQSSHNNPFDPVAIQQESGNLASITNKWNMSSTDRLSHNKSSTPPCTYICRRCNEPGHWIQQCTVQSQNNYNNKPPDGYVCKVCQSSDHYVKQCPNVLSDKQSRHTSIPPNTYLCKNCHQSGHWIQQCPSFKSSKHKNCWFCLSSDDVATNLIISIGTHFYLALPKGGLTPHHSLIIPIVHSSNICELNDEQLIELQQYKSAIKQYYASLNNVCIMYERNINTRSGQHCHIQCINMQPQLASKAQQLIVQCGNESQLQFNVINDQHSDNPQHKRKLQQCVTNNQRYIHVELPDSTELLAIVESNNKHALEFMRARMAYLLDEPDRADWNKCVVSNEQEEKLVTEFKAGFEKYDFTADE